MTRDPAPKATRGRFTPQRNGHRHPADLIGFARHRDPYPFILLNLLFSTQAAYAAPLILLIQNRQSDTDRIEADTTIESTSSRWGTWWPGTTTAVATTADASRKRSTAKPRST